MKRPGTFLLLMILMTLALCGCGKKIKDVSEIRKDLMSSKDFWLADGWEISDFMIIKRMTEEKNRKDTVYVSMKAGDEVYYETLAYTMFYTEYNDGWKLDSIEPYHGNDFTYEAVPLKAPTHEMVFEEVKLDSDIVWQTQQTYIGENVRYFFEDGTYSYSIEDEQVDLKTGSYSCTMIVDREFEMVTVHEIIDVEFWFEFSNPHLFGWNLSSSEVSKVSYDWDRESIEGIWRHPDMTYNYLFEIRAHDAFEIVPCIETSFTCKRYMDYEESFDGGCVLGPVTSKEINYNRIEYITTGKNIHAVPFYITPFGIFDRIYVNGNEWENEWEKVE